MFRKSGYRFSDKDMRKRKSVRRATPCFLLELTSRTIRMVVAFPAGGPTDFVARLLADKLKGLLGQNVIVENRAGANGAVGAEYVAHAAPDGTTLFMTTVGAVAITPHLAVKVAYDPIRDFAPITLVVRNTTILVVKPDMRSPPRAILPRWRRPSPAPSPSPRPVSAACRTWRLSSIRPPPA